MAVNKCVGIQDKIYAKLEHEANKTRQKMGTLINHHLEAYYNSQKQEEFYECRLCERLLATQLNGLCPDCLDVTQKKAKKDSEEEFDKIMNVVDAKKQEEVKEEKTKADSEIIINLKDDLRRKKNINNRYEGDKESNIENLGESEYNLRISNNRVDIKKIIKELKDLGVNTEDL